MAKCSCTVRAAIAASLRDTPIRPRRMPKFFTAKQNLKPNESDYIIGNLETPLAGEDAKYSQNHICFNAPDEYVDALFY